MQTSDNGIRILKELEGAVMINGQHVIYDDETGQPVHVGAKMPRGATIGYGHLIRPCENFDGGITETTATEILRRDLAVSERAVTGNIKVPITQNQFDALVIFAFNIGVKNFANSTVVKYINNPKFVSGIYPSLESAWLAWNKSRGRVVSGLNRRRYTEWRLFCGLI